MKQVIIIGAGGHAAEIDEYIIYSQNQTGKQEVKVIGFIDDTPENYRKYKHSAPFLGKIGEHRVESETFYVIGIANLVYRRKIVDRLGEDGAQFITFVHCNAYVSPTAVIGQGVIVAPNANIGPNVRIGNFNLLNSRCSIAHDSVLGDYNFISPNVCFSGHTEIGDENLFGINSATIPGIKVGHRNKIAAGMILDKNVGDDTVVFYRFKEKVVAVPKA